MKKVFIVDDEIEILNGLRYLIDWEKNGFEIAFSTPNPCEALEKVPELRPDIIITDIRITQMSGLDLIAKVNQISPGIHTIIISGYDEFVVAKQALRLGVSDYLLKPIDEDELLQALKRISQELDSASHASDSDESIASGLTRILWGKSGELTPSEAASLEHLEGQGDFRLVVAALAPGSAPDRALSDGVRDLLSPFGRTWHTTIGSLHYTLLCERDSIDTDLLEAIRRQPADPSPYILFSGRFGAMSQLHPWGQFLSRQIESRLFFRSAQSVRGFSAIQEFKSNYSKLYVSLLKPLFAQIKSIPSDLGFDKMEALLYKLQEILQKYSGQITPADARNAYREYISNVHYVMQSLSEVFSINHSMLDAVTIGIDRAADIQALTDQCSQALNHLVKDVLPVQNKGVCKIEYIKYYINTHLSEDLSLTRIAALFNISPGYLSALFSKSTRQPYSQHVTGMRLKKAAMLLSSTPMSISAISQMIGFASEKTFYKQFRATFHCTPTQYRQNLSGED